MFSAKRELLDEKNQHRDSISLMKSELEFDKKKYKNASNILRSAIKKYRAAELAYMRKDNAKAALRKEDAASVLKSAYIGFREMRDRIDREFDAVLSEYAILEELCLGRRDRELSKVRAEIAAVKKEYKIKLLRLDKGVLSELPAFVEEEHRGAVQTKERDTHNLPASLSDADESTHTGQKAAAANGVLKPTGHYVGMTSVNIAPITLDVSDIVEQAITTAMNKLSQGLDKKLEEYVSSVVIPTPAPQSEGTVSDEPTELPLPELEPQAELAEKVRSANAALGALMSELDEIYAVYTEAGRRFRELAEGEREILAAAKELSQMQREIMRLQQGLRVGQRILNEEQTEPEKSRAILVKKSTETEASEE